MDSGIYSVKSPLSVKIQSNSTVTGLAWPGLDWTGLDWTGLDWTRLVYLQWGYHVPEDGGEEEREEPEEGGQDQDDHLGGSWVK